MKLRLLFGLVDCFVVAVPAAKVTKQSRLIHHIERGGGRRQRIGNKTRHSVYLC